MKTKIVMLAAVIAMSHSAISFAQTSTTTVNTPSAVGTDSAGPIPSAATTNTATTNLTSVGVKPLIRYLGIMHGPGLEFSGSKQAANFGDSLDMEHRPKLGVKVNENLDVGTELRFVTTFQNSKVDYRNGNSRLYANFKNVVKTDIMALGLIPRVVLPTSNTGHNQLASFSPELIVNIDLTPKDSRFSFNTGLQLIQHMYKGTPDAAKDYAGARQTTIDPWAEIDYQISPKVQAMVSYWPDFNTTRGSGTVNEAMHELDVGAYVEVVKGWQLNPFIAADFQGLRNSSLDKNMQINLAISGAIL